MLRVQCHAGSWIFLFPIMFWWAVELASTVLNNGLQSFGGTKWYSTVGITALPELSYMYKWVTLTLSHAAWFVLLWNSFNLETNTLEILKLWHLRVIDQGSEDGLQECVYFDHFGISWPLVSFSIKFFRYRLMIHTLLSSAHLVKNKGESRTHRREPWWPWTRTWRFPNEIHPWLAVQAKYRSSNNKITYENLGQCKDCLIIQNIW